MYFVGELDVPRAGIINITKLGKAATFMPKNILERIASRAS